MRGIDALSIIAFIYSNFSHIPCIVITEQGKRNAEIKAQTDSIYNYIEKPIIFDALANAIMKSLDIHDEVRHLNGNTGIPLIFLLQLIETEGTTRLLEIHSNFNGKGFLYFNNGVLYAAVCGELKGEAAAIKIASWNKVRVEFKNIPKGKIKRQIQSSFSNFIFKSMMSSGDTITSDEELSAEPSEDFNTIELGIAEMDEEEMVEDSQRTMPMDSGKENDVEQRPQKDIVSENIIFEPITEISQEGRQKNMALDNMVFEPLKKISGFIGAEIYSGNGEVLLADAPGSINTEEVAGLAVELYKTARAIAEQMKMGIADLVEVRTESHYFLHACIVPGRAGLGVLMTKDGNVGLMRHTMRKISESLIPDFS